MISFKPIWNERAADGRDDGGDARPKVAALVDFKPLWRDDQVSRKFVAAAGGMPLARNEVSAVDSGLVAEKSAAGQLAASASPEPAIASVAAEHLPENAVATSQLLTREEHERLLAIAERIEPLSWVPHVFASSEIGWRKPAPEFFRWIEQRLGCGPTEVLLVGDDPELDVAAARRAGWRSLNVTAS